MAARLFSGLLSALTFAQICTGGPILPRQSASQITRVNLAANTGNSVHRASGILYGVPDNGGQIPSSFYTDMGFNYLSAGGAQHPNGGGWVKDGYTARFQSSLANYRTAKQYGAGFILKMSDLWGADGQSISQWPGDNGDWTEFDHFLTQLVSDLKANSMTDLKLLIWNEPDLSIFWARSQDQYENMWSHAVRFLRSNLAGVPIAGPSMAFRPATSNTWWTRFLQKVKNDNTAPDVYSWHLEGDTNDATNDLQFSHDNMVNMLNSYGLHIGEFVIDEYANQDEQQPGGAAWWIANFERWNMYGLRGNWVGGTQLHDFFASLLGKPDVNSWGATGYYGNGEYQVYKYYASTMKGHRVATTQSTDKKMDCYAVVDTNRVRVLVGGRRVTGTYQLSIDNLSAIGLPTSGTVSVHTLEFAYNGRYGRVDGPKDLGYVSHSYSGNTLSFPIYQTSTTTTWAFEFDY
ncbi:glycoside hydrolase family 39 protein [Moniliophthora roreri]|uniref:Glycoside hydrolase family 39 protein n=3 Tax=Moniliophthora roreri TaxID=221103 RepID=A0A0W0G5C8_MONRR|nr:glycoside hydrolase family 39 protein [Moniliophthora roreri]